MSYWRVTARKACLILSSFAAPLVASAQDAPAREPSLTAKVYQVADLITPLSPSASTNSVADYESLLDLIELRTGTDCWKEGGGQGTINAHEPTLSLVIHQTQAMHERIADLLSELRGTGDLAIQVEMRFLKGNLDACEHSRPNRSTQGIVDAAGKERILAAFAEHKDHNGHTPLKITFFNGQSSVIQMQAAEHSTAAEVRGVISKDNRYARLWVDTKVDGEASHLEVLVPEGHTAVRKLPGENSWLLLTSHVINAEEPQVIVPRKESPAPTIERKRYLVPVDDTPDPAELTAIPEFKAQAELFGITVKLAATLDAHESIAEKASPVVADQPSLALGVEHIAFEVAHVEPAGSGLSEGPAFAFVDLNLQGSESPACEKSVCNAQLLRETREKKPAALHHTGNGSVQIHYFTNSDEPAEPPAHLDLCLDGDAFSSATVNNNSVKPGQFFDRVFMQPAPKVFPMPLSSVPAPARKCIVFDERLFDAEKIFRAQSQSSGAVLNFLATPPAAYQPQGMIVELNDGQPLPMQFLWQQQAPNQTLHFFPTPAAPRVQQASNEEKSSSIDEHLVAAAKELDELGLVAEANTVRELLNVLGRKAQQRCEQIDAEISRLKEERGRLEALSPVPSGSRIHILGTMP